MTYNPKISIVMPNYNGIKYLEKAINGFLNQDYENKELILVDGKSTDDSHNIIEKYCNSNDFIKWVKEEDKNVSDAFNIGLKYVKGEIVGFMSTDSIYYTNDIFKAISFNYSKFGFDAIYFDAYSHFVNERSIVLRSCNYSFDRDTFFKIGCFLPFENILFKKEVFETQKLDPQFNMSSDIDFYYRILGNKILALYINKVSTINIYDGKNLSVVNASRQQKEWRRVDIKYLFEKLEEKDFELNELILTGGYPITKSFIKDSETWILKILDANRQKNYFSEQVIIDRYLPVWRNLIIAGQKLGLGTYYTVAKSPLYRHLNLTTAQRAKLWISCLIGPIRG